MQWIQLCPSKIHVHGGPQNVTLFGNRVFVDLIHYRSSDEITLGLEWAVKSSDKREKGGRFGHRETQRVSL